MHTIAEFSKKETTDKLSKIWLAIMEMNVSSLFYLLEDNVEYEDMSKLKFINKLLLTIEKQRLLGDNELYLDLDVCVGCNCSSPVCKFIGNNSKHSFALYFEFKDNLITDIYHCNFYGKIDFDNPF